MEKINTMFFNLQNYIEIRNNQIVKMPKRKFIKLEQSHLLQNKKGTNEDNGSKCELYRMGSSNGSNKSKEGLNEHEISYLKSLADDNGRMLALVQKINSLEEINTQLVQEKRSIELNKLEIEGRFERMLLKSKVSTLEIELIKLVKTEMELKSEISRFEINGSCVTHEKQIREQQQLIKELKVELGHSRNELTRLREENDQLRSDKLSKREGSGPISKKD
ncbi:hypothetical protein ACTFIU_008848 [Dictyostelium citrinum]